MTEEVNLVEELRKWMIAFANRQDSKTTCEFFIYAGDIMKDVFRVRIQQLEHPENYGTVS